MSVTYKSHGDAPTAACMNALFAAANTKLQKMLSGGKSFLLGLPMLGSLACAQHESVRLKGRGYLFFNGTNDGTSHPYLTAYAPDWLSGMTDGHSEVPFDDAVDDVELNTPPQLPWLSIDEAVGVAKIAPIVTDARMGYFDGSLETHRLKMPVVEFVLSHGSAAVPASTFYHDPKIDPAGSFYLNRVVTDFNPTNRIRLPHTMTQAEVEEVSWTVYWTTAARELTDPPYSLTFTLAGKLGSAPNGLAYRVDLSDAGVATYDAAEPDGDWWLHEQQRACAPERRNRYGLAEIVVENRTSIGLPANDFKFCCYRINNLQSAVLTVNIGSQSFTVPKFGSKCLRYVPNARIEFTVAHPGILTSAEPHGFADGDQVWFYATRIPKGMPANSYGRRFFVSGTATNNVALAETAGGATWTLTSDGAGIVLEKVAQWEASSMAYFHEFVPGDPMSYWWPRTDREYALVRSFIPVLEAIELSEYGMGDSANPQAAQMVSNSPHASNLTNPAILLDWLEIFSRECDPGASSFVNSSHVRKNCLLFTDIHERCDMAALGLTGGYGDANDDSTLIADLFFHQGGIKLDITEIATGEIATDYLQFRGFSTIISDFAAKHVVVAPPDIFNPNGMMTSESGFSITATQHGTNLLGTMEPVNLDGGYALSMSIFEDVRYFLNAVNREQPEHCVRHKALSPCASAVFTDQATQPTVDRGAWAAGGSYLRGDIVKWRGVKYLCLHDNSTTHLPQFRAEPLTVLVTGGPLASGTFDFAAAVDGLPGIVVRRDSDGAILGAVVTRLNNSTCRLHIEATLPYQPSVANEAFTISVTYGSAAGIWGSPNWYGFKAEDAWDSGETYDEDHVVVSGAAIFGCRGGSSGDDPWEKSGRAEFTADVTPVLDANGDWQVSSGISFGSGSSGLLVSETIQELSDMNDAGQEWEPWELITYRDTGETIENPEYYENSGLPESFSVSPQAFTRYLPQSTVFIASDGLGVIDYEGLTYDIGSVVGFSCRPDEMWADGPPANIKLSGQFNGQTWPQVLIFKTDRRHVIDSTGIIASGSVSLNYESHGFDLQNNGVLSISELVTYSDRTDTGDSLVLAVDPAPYGYGYLVPTRPAFNPFSHTVGDLKSLAMFSDIGTGLTSTYTQFTNISLKFTPQGPVLMFVERVKAEAQAIASDCSNRGGWMQLGSILPPGVRMFSPGVADTAVGDNEARLHAPENCWGEMRHLNGLLTSDPAMGTPGSELAFNSGAQNIRAWFGETLNQGEYELVGEWLQRKRAILFRGNGFGMRNDKWETTVDGYNRPRPITVRHSEVLTYGSQYPAAPMPCVDQPGGTDGGEDAFAYARSLTSSSRYGERIWFQHPITGIDGALHGDDFSVRSPKLKSKRSIQRRIPISETELAGEIRGWWLPHLAPLLADHYNMMAEAVNSVYAVRPLGIGTYRLGPTHLSLLDMQVGRPGCAPVGLFCLAGDYDFGIDIKTTADIPNFSTVMTAEIEYSSAYIAGGATKWESSSYTVAGAGSVAIRGGVFDLSVLSGMAWLHIDDIKSWADGYGIPLFYEEVFEPLLLSLVSGGGFSDGAFTTASGPPWPYGSSGFSVVTSTWALKPVHSGAPDWKNTPRVTVEGPQAIPIPDLWNIDSVSGANSMKYAVSGGVRNIGSESLLPLQWATNVDTYTSVQADQSAGRVLLDRMERNEISSIGFILISPFAGTKGMVAVPEWYSKGNSSFASSALNYATRAGGSNPNYLLNSSLVRTPPSEARQVIGASGTSLSTAYHAINPGTGRFRVHSTGARIPV